MQTIRAETAEAEGKRLQAEVEQLQRLQRFAGKIRTPCQWHPDRTHRKIGRIQRGEANRVTILWIIAIFGEPEFSNHPICTCAMMLKIFLPQQCSWAVRWLSALCVSRGFAGPRPISSSGGRSRREHE